MTGMSNDLISRSMAIEEFYKRVSADLTIGDVKYIEGVLEGVPTACHVDMVIDKMDEIIRKYRKLGTPEEIERMRKYSALAKKHDTIGKVIESGAEYEEIGTVEECRAAMEKRKAIRPEKASIPGGFVYECKACGNDLPAGISHLKYCPWCGQAFDWSE